MSRLLPSFALVALVVALAPAHARADSLACPAVSANTTFAGTTVQTECTSSITEGCTSKSGTSYESSTSLLLLPGAAGNFQPPPGSAVAQNVYYGTAGDFDHDGWEDFVASDNADRIYLMRNQTVTCGTTGCSGSATVAPTVQTIASTWWETLTNVRTAAFRTQTTSTGLKPTIGTSNTESPMAAGDFDGDGWSDVFVISATNNAGGNPRWPTAARLFMNTQNCHDASYNPCGVGTLCTGQPANGTCSGAGTTGSGVAFTESNLSCTNTATCGKYFATFATYDARTGTSVTGTGTTTTTPTTTKPGDFGPIGHSAQNIVVVDFDGDGDLDLLIGHSTGTCPGALCTTASQVFYSGIDVWRNDCAQSAQWNATARSCVGHIPAFSHSTTGTCNGTSCNNTDVLLPSTAHNTTTIAPSTNLGIDTAVRENLGFAYSDIDQDGDYDLVVGSPGCCSSSANAGNRLRVFRGTSNSKTVHTLDTATPIVLSTSNGTYPGFEGSLTGVFVNDFSGDGYPDIVTGSDGVAYSASLGGRTRYWKNTGDPANPFGKNWPTCSSAPASCTNCSATCNPNPTTKMSESCGNANCANQYATPPTFGDFDIGFMLDYDHDPKSTRDMVLTNGNNTSEFYVFANRASPATYAACGNVVSGTLPTPASELTVSGACITPTASTPAGTSITYYVNNESPANFQLACTQTSAGFTPALTSGQCCVTFASSTGRTLTWKAVLDSNTTDGTGVCSSIGTSTPTVTSVVANYTYTAVGQHYKAGVVINDGVSYVGSFTQPGNRGHMYALAAGDGSKYFDVATKLDAQSTRNIYTTDLTGTGLTRIDFAPGSPSAALQSRVGASSGPEATSVINWVLSARFGVGSTSFAATKLGAVQSSTPAIVARPYRPNWYAFLSSAEKASYDAFASAHETRLPLVLFASMDGMIHAVISNAANMLDSHNGQEAWAFVPPFVASNMKADWQATTAAHALTVTSYPDGSPGLIDYKKSDGNIATATVISDGVGSTSVTALDVTDTIDPTTFSVTNKGPRPMWSQQPGGAAAGQATSKPGIARVKIGGVEHYVVITGTGVHATDSSKGKIIAGYELETGALLWKYELDCALTSDITVFETDDEGPYEPGAPILDGFADRAVFADACGSIYKIDPAQDLSGGFMGNAGLGPIVLAQKNGRERTALFGTGTTSGALATGQQRPIVGTLGARTDATTDMVLFFGTGGLEAQSPTLVNEFYAVYAKDGAIRNKLTGTCTAGRCEKFYNGVVVTPTAVIVQRSVDPVVGGGSCDFGSSSVQSYGLEAPYTQQFNLTAAGGVPYRAVTGPIYGDAGALYFATVAGQIERVGTPRSTAAGGDSTSGAVHSEGASDTTYVNAPFTLLGWRTIL
ncbi:MAG: VCBS repeat-containing protein [Myxococcales bacterium]|nr:VCBS repeat-containing protein [Myxococcales bacterium]